MPTWIVFGLAMLTLGLGMVYSVWLGESIRFYDERLYIQLANNLVEAHIYSLDGVTPTAYRPPGYNFSLYPIFWFEGKIVHIRLMQFGLLALSIILLHYLLLAWSYPLASLIAGFAVFAYPVQFFSAGTIYPQTLTAFVFLLVCVCVVRPQVGLTHWLLGGLAFGSLLLITPIFLVLLPLLFLWPWILNMQRRVWANVIFVVATVIVVIPWQVRNDQAFNQFVFISANSGLMLVLGNSEHTSPTAGSTTNIDKYLDYAHANDMNEIEEDEYFKREALKWISSHPRDAIKLYVMKFLNHFHYRNELEAKAEHTWVRDLVMFISYYTLLVLAVLRIIVGRQLRSRPFESFAVVSYLVMGAVYAVFFTRIRYRLPMDWMLTALAAIALASLLKVFGGNHSGALSKGIGQRIVMALESLVA
jgi:hypothetical protein